MGELLWKFWITEAFGVTHVTQTLRSKEDQRAMDILERTAKWVSKNSALKEKYIAKYKEYQEKGYAVL